MIEDFGISPERDVLPFIKIDAEESEPLILQGMAQTLEQFRPAIWLEINRFSLRAGGFQDKIIEQLLCGAGYQLYRFHESRDVFLRLKFSAAVVHSLSQEAGELFDVLAVPRDSYLVSRLDSLYAGTTYNAREE